MLPTSPINQNPQPTQPFQVASKTGELAGKRYIPIDTAFLEEKTPTSLLAQGIIKPLSLAAYLGCMVVENSAWLVGGSIDIATKEKNINALIDCALDVTTSVADEANRRSTLGGVAGMTTEVAVGAVGGTFGQLISWTTGKRDSGKRDPGLLETGGYVAGNLAGEQLGKGAAEGINRGITIGVTGLAGALVPEAGVVAGAAANAIVNLSRNAIHGAVTAPSNLTMYQVNLSAKVGYTVSPYLSCFGKLVSAFVNYTGQKASEAKEGIWDIYKRPTSLGTSIARAVSPWSGWLMREWGDAELAKHIAAFEQGKRHKDGRAITMEQFASMLPQEQNALLWLCQNTSRIPLSPINAEAQLKKLLDWQNAPANSKAKNKLKSFVEQLLRNYSKLSKAQQALLTPSGFKAMLPQDKLRFLKFIQEKGAYSKALTHQPQLQQQLEKISKETHYPADSKEYDLDALERLAIITFNYNYMGEKSREFLDQFSPLSEAYLNNLSPEAKGDLLLAIMEKSSTSAFSATQLGQMKFEELFATFNSTFSAAERFQILTLISNKSPLLFKSIDVVELTEAEYLEIEKKIAEKILNGPALKPEEDQIHRKKLLQIEALAIVEARSANLQKTAQKVSQKGPAPTPVDRQVVEGKIQYDSGVPEQQAMGTFGKSIQWLFGSTGMVVGLMADIGASEKNPFTSPAVLVPLVHATATSLELAGQFKFTQTLLATQLHKFPWVSQSVMAINNATIWTSTKFAAASNAALSYLLSKEESLHTTHLKPFFDQINAVADAKQTTDIEQLKKNGEQALLGMHQEFANGLPSGITLTPFDKFYTNNFDTAFKQAQESIEITEGITDKKREALILQKTYATIATTMGSQLQIELTRGLQEIKEKQGVVGNTLNAFWGMFNLSQEQTATVAQEQLTQKIERSGFDMILKPKAGIKAETMLNEALETLETTKNSWTAYAQGKGAQLVGTLYTHVRDELRSDFEITNTALEYASSISESAATLTIRHQNLMLQGPQRLAESLKLKGEEYQRVAGANWNSSWTASFTKGAGFIAEKVGTALDIANGRFYVRVATRTAAQLIRIFGVEAAYLVRPAFKNLSSFVKRSSQTIGGEVGELAEFLYGTAKDTLITAPNEQRIQNFLHLDPQEKNYVIELVQVAFPEVLSSTLLEKKDKSQEEETAFAKRLLTAFDKIGPGKQICMTPSLLTSRPPETREGILKTFNLPATTDDLQLCRLLWKADEPTKRKFAQLTPEEFYALPKEEQKDLLFLATTSDAAMKTYDSISSWGIDYNGLCDSISKDKLEKILLLHTQIEVKDRRKLKPTTLLKFGPAKMREIRDLLQKTGNLDHLSEEQKKVLTYLDFPFDSISPDINRFQRQAVNYLCYLFNRRDWVSLQPAEKEAILTLSPAGIKELSNAEQLLLLQELPKIHEQSYALEQVSTFLQQNLLHPTEKLSDIQVEAISSAFNALPKNEKIALYDTQFSQRELLHLYLGMHTTATTRATEAHKKAEKSSNQDIKTKFKEKAEGHLRAAQSLQSLIEGTFFEPTVSRTVDQEMQKASEKQQAIEQFSYQILKQILAKFPANERLGVIDGKLQQNREHLLQNPDNKLRLHLETETKLLEKIRLELQPKSSIAPTSTFSPPPPVIDIVTKVRWWLRSLVSFSSDTIGRWGKELHNLSGSQAGGKMAVQVLKRANGLIASWQEGETTYHERFTLQKGFFGTTYLASNRTGCTFSRPQELEEYLKKIEAPMKEKLISKTSTSTPTSTPAPLKRLLKSIRQIKREEGSLESVARKYFLTRSGSTLMLERRVESGIGKPLQKLKRAIFHASYDVNENLQLLQAENRTSKYRDDLDELVSQFAEAPFSRESLLTKIKAYHKQVPLADKFYAEAAATGDIQKLTRFTHLLHRLTQDLTTLTTCEKNLSLLSNEEAKKIVSKEIRIQKEAILNQLKGITTDSIDNIEYPDLDLKGIETAILEDRLAQSAQLTRIVKLETQFKKLLAHSPVISKSSPFFRPYRRLLSVQLRHLEEMKSCCMDKRWMSWKQLNRLESSDSFLVQYSQIVVDLQQIDESIGKIRTTIEQAQKPEKEETKYAFEERIKQLKTELHTAEKRYAKQLTSLIEGIDKGTKQIAPEEWHSKLRVDLSGLARFEGAVLRASRLATLDIAGMKQIQELLDPQNNNKVAKLVETSRADKKARSDEEAESDKELTNREVLLFANGVADNITRWRFLTGDEMHITDSAEQLDIQQLISRFPTEKTGAPLEQVAIRVVQKEIEALRTSLPALFKHELLQKAPLTMESLEYLELISQETHATLQAINQRLISIFNMKKTGTNSLSERFQEADVLANALTKLLLSTIESSPISPSKKKLLAGSIVATYKLTFQVDKEVYSDVDTSQNVNFFIRTINELMSSIPEWESATATIDTTTTKPLNLLLKDMSDRYILTHDNKPTAEGTKDPQENKAVKVGAVINRAMGILQLQTGKNAVKAAAATWILQKLSDLQLKGTAAEFEEWIAISEKLLDTTDNDTKYEALYKFHNELGLEIGRLGLLYGIEGTNDTETLTLLTHAKQLQLHFDQAIYKAHLAALNKLTPTHIPTIDAAKIKEEFIQYRDALKTAVEKRESDKSSERLLDAFLQNRYGRILPKSISQTSTAKERIEVLKQAILSQKLQKKSGMASDLQALLATTDTFINEQMKRAQEPTPAEGFAAQETYIHALWTLDCIQILNSEILTPGLLALHLLALATTTKIRTPLHTLLKWENGKWENGVPTNKFSDLQAISLDVLRQTVEAIKVEAIKAEVIEANPSLPSSIAILENTLLEFEKQSQLENSK